MLLLFGNTSSGGDPGLTAAALFSGTQWLLAEGTVFTFDPDKITISAWIAFDAEALPSNQFIYELYDDVNGGIVFRVWIDTDDKIRITYVNSAEDDTIATYRTGDAIPRDGNYYPFMIQLNASDENCGGVVGKSDGTIAIQTMEVLVDNWVAGFGYFDLSRVETSRISAAYPGTTNRIRAKVWQLTACINGDTVKGEEGTAANKFFNTDVSPAEPREWGTAMEEVPSPRSLSMEPTDYHILPPPGFQNDTGDYPNVWILTGTLGNTNKPTAVGLP